MTELTEEEFKKACDDFAATEEAAIMAALEKQRELHPDMSDAERFREVHVALLAGSWRTALMLNQGRPTSETKAIWLQLATEFADDNQTIPEENSKGKTNGK